MEVGNLTRNHLTCAACAAFLPKNQVYIRYMLCWPHKPNPAALCHALSNILPYFVGEFSGKNIVLAINQSCCVVIK